MSAIHYRNPDELVYITSPNIDVSSILYAFIILFLKYPEYRVQNLSIESVKDKWEGIYKKQRNKEGFNRRK